MSIYDVDFADNIVIGAMHMGQPADFIMAVVKQMEKAGAPLPPLLQKWKDDLDQIRAWKERNSGQSYVARE